VRYSLFIVCFLFLLLNPAACFAKPNADSFIVILDHNKKICPADEAVFLRKVIKQGDLWHVEDYYANEKKEEMEGDYLDSALTLGDGMFYWYYPNGKFKGKGRYANGKKQGAWRHYYENGSLEDSGFYKSGVPCKLAYKWHENGKIAMNGIYDDSGNGTGTETFYDDDGTMDSYGKFVNGYKKDSTWTYFFKNGKLAAKEYYSAGKMQKMDYYNREGILDSTVAIMDKPGDTDRVDEDEIVYAHTMLMPFSPYNINEYLSKNINYPDEAREHDIEGRIDVKFIIDEEGNINDVKSMLHQELRTSLENEAVRVVKIMPKWNPGRLHNRPVKVYFVLPVSFKLT